MLWRFEQEWPLRAQVFSPQMVNCLEGLKGYGGVVLLEEVCHSGCDLTFQKLKLGSVAPCLLPVDLDIKLSATAQYHVCLHAPYSPP